MGHGGKTLDNQEILGKRSDDHVLMTFKQFSCQFQGAVKRI